MYDNVAEVVAALEPLWLGEDEVDPSCPPGSDVPRWELARVLAQVPEHLLADIAGRLQAEVGSLVYFRQVGLAFPNPDQALRFSHYVDLLQTKEILPS